MTLDRVGSADILRCTAGVLEVVLSVDGVPTDPDPSPAPNVTVVGGDGATLVAAALATVIGGGSGRLQVVLTPAETAQVADLTATWSFSAAGINQSVTTSHRVVGDVLFTLGEARA